MAAGATETNDPQKLEQLALKLGFRFSPFLDPPDPPRIVIRGDFDRIVGSWGRENLIVPMGERDGKIVVAMSDPLNYQAREQLKLCYGKPLEIVITTEAEVRKAINAVRTKLMSGRDSALDAEDSDEGDEFNAPLKIDVTDAEDEDAPIIRYLNAIIFKASSERASDVHIECFEQNVKVRFRIDGVLYDIATEDKAFQNAIVSRVKVMAGMNIAEKRLPQDNRIGLKIAGRDVDIRVSTIPTQFGERVVMRLLDKTGTVLGIEQLGLDPIMKTQLERLIRRPNGILLVTGPTGSGKTTTLYSCLSRINAPDVNILTVEDPIEYQLEGIGQMQVNPKIDFTFGSGLRAILRQDPDVVMVGEIRDRETVEVAIQASLTGHLVLATLHTNDSPGAITRLSDMGAEPFLVASSLIGVLAQRLVRRLCPHCRQEYLLSDSEIIELGLQPSQVKSREAYRPGGVKCEHCHNLGYLGRVGIYELLLIDDHLRPLIMQRSDSNTIKQTALAKQHFKTLRHDGARLVREGVTSVEEVLLATHDDIATDA